MQSRLGNSKDLSAERRIEIFNTYQKYKNKKPLTEIAKMLGYTHSIGLHTFRKTKWWKELEDEQRR